MKDYKRLTQHITAVNTGRKCLIMPTFKDDVREHVRRLAELEDKIDSGEIDYVAYKDAEIERLTKECDSKEEAYNKCYFDYRYWKDKAKECKHRAEVAENKLFDLAMFCTKGNRNFHGKSESEHEEEARKLFNEWLKQSDQELQEDRK